MAGATAKGKDLYQNLFEGELWVVQGNLDKGGNAKIVPAKSGIIDKNLHEGLWERGSREKGSRQKKERPEREESTKATRNEIKT